MHFRLSAAGLREGAELIRRLFIFLAFAWLIATGSVYLSGHHGPDPSGAALNILIGFVVLFAIGQALGWVFTGPRRPR